MCVIVGHNPTQKGPKEPNLDPNQQQIGLPKLFLGYLDNFDLQEQFWAKPNNKMGQIRFMTKQFVISMPHRMPHQILSIVAKLQESSYDVL